MYLFPQLHGKIKPEYSVCGIWMVHRKDIDDKDIATLIRIIMVSSLLRWTCMRHGFAPKFPALTVTLAHKSNVFFVGSPWQGISNNGWQPLALWSHKSVEHFCTDKTSCTRLRLNMTAGQSREPQDSRAAVYFCCKQSILPVLFSDAAIFLEGARNLEASSDCLAREKIFPSPWL